jgi:hypothetical protein
MPKRSVTRSTKRGGEIGAGRKFEFVHARAHRIAFEQRRVAATVGIGVVAAEQGAETVLDPEQLQRDAGAGAAVRGVEHVGGQLAHQCTFAQ